MIYGFNQINNGQNNYGNYGIPYLEPTTSGFNTSYYPINSIGNKVCTCTVVSVNDDQKFIWMLQKLIKENLKDDRHPFKIKYPLDVILTVVMLAGTGGMILADDIVTYWICHYDDLKNHIYGFPDDIPSADTIRRVIKNLHYKDLMDTVIFKLNQRLIDEYKKKHPTNDIKSFRVLDADGQGINSSKTSHNKGDRRKSNGFDIVSIYNVTIGIVLHQTVVEKKNNEANAMFKMIPEIDITGCTITFDALNTRKDVLELILNSGGAYLVSLKTNNGGKRLFDAIKQKFNILPRNSTRLRKINKCKKVKTAKYESGGQITDKKFEFLPASVLPEWVTRGWPGLNTIIKVTTTRVQKTCNKTSKSERYFISSHSIDANDDADDAIEALVDTIFKKWGIESQVHAQTDNHRTWDQDNHRIKCKDYAQNRTALTKFAFNAVNQAYLNSNAYSNDKYIDRQMPFVQVVNNCMLKVENAIKVLRFYFEGDKQLLIDCKIAHEPDMPDVPKEEVEVACKLDTDGEMKFKVDKLLTEGNRCREFKRLNS